MYINRYKNVSTYMLHKLPYFTDTHKYYYITYIKSDSKISKKKPYMECIIQITFLIG